VNSKHISWATLKEFPSHIDALAEIDRLRKEISEERQMSETFETLLRDATDEIERLRSLVLTLSDDYSDVDDDE
jgi:hypothetical protein